MSFKESLELSQFVYLSHVFGQRVPKCKYGHRERVPKCKYGHRESTDTEKARFRILHHLQLVHECLRDAVQHCSLFTSASVMPYNTAACSRVPP